MGTQNRGFVAAVVLTGFVLITAHNPARAGDYRASPAGSGAQIPGPKLSTQQLSQPTLNVNKPIAVPNKPITVLSAPKAYSPNLNKLIAAPTVPTASLAASNSRNLNKPIAAATTGTIAGTPRRNQRDSTHGGSGDSLDGLLGAGGGRDPCQQSGNPCGLHF
jgi:hypothetical protein